MRFYPREPGICLCGAKLPPDTMDPHAAGLLWTQLWFARDFARLNKVYALAMDESAKANDIEVAEEFRELRDTVRWFLGWTDADDARERQEQAERRHTDNAWRADEMVKAAHLGTNGYLHRAGFPDLQGLVADDGALVIPIRHLKTGELRAVQVVLWLSDTREWSLTFPFGLPPLSVLRIGPNRPQATIICQSYVNALSLKAALEQMRMQATVIATFSDFNQRQVVAALENAPYDRCVGPENANELHRTKGLLPLCGVVMDSLRERRMARL